MISIKNNNTWNYNTLIKFNNVFILINNKNVLNFLAKSIGLKNKEDFLKYLNLTYDDIKNTFYEVDIITNVPKKFTVYTENEVRNTNKKILSFYGEPIKSTIVNFEHYTGQYI